VAATAGWRNASTCEVFRQIVGPDNWSRWPSRIEAQMDDLLQLLDETNVKATFFVLGQVARTRPDIVESIVRAGHEVACHGDKHEMIARLGPDGFRQDTADGKACLEDITGQAVTGYRAATFGLVRATAWAIDILAELGFAYDSSVQPVRHDRYGVPEAPVAAHVAIGPGGGRILELPPMTGRLVGRNIPLGGGGYFRLLPVVVFDRALRAWSRRNQPAMLYLHPWEFDADQPVVPVGRMNNFRHRVNLKRTTGKLRTLLIAHRFCTARNLLGELQASTNQTFIYAEAQRASA